MNHDVGQAMHIAGVGASAGGLEAMLPMFARMQATGRIAFVVAQHMAKDGHDATKYRSAKSRPFRRTSG